jgi:hypothetical protein
MRSLTASVTSFNGWDRYCPISFPIAVINGQILLPGKRVRFKGFTRTGRTNVVDLVISQKYCAVDGCPSIFPQTLKINDEQLEFSDIYCRENRKSGNHG